MDEETQQRCMEPFFTTKGEGGTGLGLGLVFGIVRRHDGEIALQSALGQGTTFSVSLPVRIEPEAVVVEEGDASGPMARSLRILCVDDEERILEVVRGYLVIDGHEVVTAGDGVEALVKFNEGRFDVVISDQAMPHMNGSQLAAAIEKAAPGKPFILLSGFGEMSGEDGEADPTRCSLTKPITVTQLRQALQQVMTGEGERA